jgi:hypothetical protein
MHYEFESAANPIKLQQLRVQEYRISNKAKEIPQDSLLSDTVWRQMFYRKVQGNCVIPGDSNPSKNCELE